MALFPRIFGARQDELHTPQHINDLGSALALALSADSDNLPPRLGYPALSPPVAHKPSTEPSNRRSQGRSKAKLVQFNVDISAELKRAVKAITKRRRITLAAAGSEALAAWVDKHSQ